MKRYITLLSAMLTTMAGMAVTTNDTINRMVLVESTYNPIITGAVKRNFIPEEVKPTMNKEKVVYADENIAITHFDRKAQPAPIADVMPEKGTPGYARFGGGTYNNIDALAAYKFRWGNTGDLAVKAHLDGWNGMLTPTNGTRWRSHLYDTGVNTDCNMLLGSVALNIGMHAAYHDYNYLAHSNPNTQTTTQHAGYLGVYASVKGSAWEHYHYQASVDYTHYGRSTHFTYKTPHSEGYLHGEASIGRACYDWGMATLLLRSDVLTYRGIASHHDYYSWGVTPRWEYQYGDFRLVGGINLDFLGGGHTQATQVPLQVSPACSISYVPGKRFSGKLMLDGGRDIHSYAQLYALSPYWASHGQVQPTYTYLNAHLEGNLRIIEGLHLHLGGGYRVLSDALFETVIDSAGVTYTGITNHNAQVVTVDGAITYKYKDLVTLSTKGKYYHWVLQGNRTLLARAPLGEASADARVRIIPGLHAYSNLRLVVFTDSEVLPRERSIIDWSLGIHYTVNKRLTLFADAHNLLGRRHSYYTGYPSQGFSILAGAMFKF